MTITVGSAGTSRLGVRAHERPGAIDRRSLLAGIGAVTLTSAARAQGLPYDLIVRGGTVIDPSQSLNAIGDVGIKNGVVAAVEAALNPADAAEVYDASGKIVTPGLVDIVAHNWPDGTVLGVAADAMALTGVTTSVSPGDVGAPAVPAFRKTAVQGSRASVFAWLSISSVGYLPFLRSNLGLLAYADEAAATKALIANWDILLGVKVLLGYSITGHLAPADDLTPLRRALAACNAAAAATGKTFRVMTHIGGMRTPTQLAEVVDLMRPGDIITHSFVGYPNHVGQATGFAQAGTVIQAAYDAKTKGIILDSGYSGSFDYLTAAICMCPINRPGHGIRLDTLSSDHYSSAAGIGTSKTLPEVMSEFLALNKVSKINFHGVPDILPDFASLPDLSPEITLDDVVRMATNTPGQLIGRVPKLGTLQIGAPGDVAILQLATGSFTFNDSLRRALTGTQKLVPVKTVKAGVLI